MTWLDKLERKFGSYAIPNLSRYFVIATFVGFALSFASPGMLSFLSFDPASVLHGQVWRLFTWIVVPVTSMDFLGMLFLVCVLMWGSSLESFIGTFQMNVFLIQGILINDIGGLLFYLITRLILGTGLPVYLSAHYLLFTILLALAICMPEAEVRIYFVLPVRMKWMLIVELLYLAYIVYSCFETGVEVYGKAFGLLAGFVMSAQIIFALLNLALFFFLAKPYHISRKHKKRQKQFRAQFAAPRPGSGITKHKCTICGRTELDAPDMTFRYCSKCAGSHEYCEEHLYTHQHIDGLKGGYYS